MFPICQADVNAKTPAYKNYLKGMKSKTTGKGLVLPSTKRKIAKYIDKIPISTS